jgi:succinate dehydrogenase/fumarate reductase flavoprotein subunit
MVSCAIYQVERAAKAIQRRRAFLDIPTPIRDREKPRDIAEFARIYPAVDRRTELIQPTAHYAMGGILDRIQKGRVSRLEEGQSRGFTRREACVVRGGANRLPDELARPCRVGRRAKDDAAWHAKEARCHRCASKPEEYARPAERPRSHERR